MPGEHSHEGPDRQHHHDYRSCPLCAELERLNTEITKEVWPAIDKLRDQQSDMNVNIATIGEQLKAITTCLTRIERQQTEFIESRALDVQAKLAGWKRATLVVAGSIITAVGAAIGWLVQWLIEKGD